MNTLIVKIVAACVALLVVVLLILRLTMPHTHAGKATEAVPPVNDPTGMTQDTPPAQVTIPNPFPNANK
jgi:hypothetical protein